LILASLTLSGCEDPEEALAKINAVEINEVNLAQINDGQYTGVYEFDGITTLKAKVEVLVSNNKIVNIKIIEHNNWRGGEAEKLPEIIIEKQSLKVDTISGATYSSKVILKAVENALNQ
jgi:uncharacterized protein with FMN-binding domain